MANHIAELFKTWKGYLDDVAKTSKTVANLSKAVFDEQSFGPLKKHAKELAVRNNMLSASYSNMQKSIKETEEKIKNSTRRNDIEKFTKELEKLKKTAASHPGNIEKADKSKSEKDKKKDEKSGGLLGVVKGLFSKDKLLDLGKDILVKGMGQEKNITSLAVRMGNKRDAAFAYAGIKADARATPFDTDSLFEANKALIYAGVSARAAREDVLSLGRAVSFSGGGNDDLTKMAELMAKVKETGNASAEDLKKFAEGGVDVYAALSRATGKNVEDVKNMSVSYDGLSAALHNAGVQGGPFAGAMEQINQTATSKLGNFTDSLESGLADIGVAFMPVLKRLLDFAMILINTLLPKIMLFIQPVIDMLNSLPLEALLGDVMNWVGAILAAVGPILENLKPLFAAIFESLEPLVHATYQFAMILVNMVGPYLAAVAKLISAVVGPVIRILGAILTWVYEQMAKVLKWFQPIYEGLTKFINKTADAINRFMKWVGLGGKEDEKEKQKGPRDQAQQFFIPDTNVLPSDKTPPGDQSLWKAGDIANPATGKDKKPAVQTADKAAGEITSGGPRVININGVKFTDKIELHVLNAKEGIKDLEAQLQEMFLRILNHGVPQ